MSENKPKETNYIRLGLAWLGAALMVLGATRWVTGVWSPEAAEYAGSSNVTVSIILIAVGAVMVVGWAIWRNLA